MAARKVRAILDLLTGKPKAKSPTPSQNICVECSKLFTSVNNLENLLSPGGLKIKKRHYIDFSRLGCQLCNLLILHGTIPPGSRWSDELHIHAEFNDEGMVPAMSKYPSKILLIKIISLWNPNLAIENATFFTLYTDSDSRITEYLNLPPFPYDFSDYRNINEALRKMQVCHGSHIGCFGAEGFLPTRVIDVGYSGDQSTVKIHISSYREKGRYATLSYCWGKIPQQTLILGRAQELENGVLLTSLSKAIQDAVRVTRALRIRFLWVDALCIIQDSPNDVAREINNMCSIYKNATVTIVAAHSESAHLGFLEGNAPFSGCELPFLLPDGSIKTIIAVPSGTGPRKLPLPLHTRAWSMQEQMLSPRQLVFNFHGIGWQCRTSSFEPLLSSPFEPFPSADADIPKLPSLISSFDPSARQTQQFLWEEIVKEYSRRKLTFFGDRLPALAGVAAELQGIWKDIYVAGLWRNSFVANLLWIVEPAPLDRHPNGTHQYIAPSWSWLAVPNKVDHFALIRSITATVHSFSIVPLDGNAPLGKIKSGYVDLITTACDYSAMKQYSGLDKGMTHLDFPETDDLITDLLFLRMGHYRHNSNNEVTGLLIIAVGDGTFRRVGMFQWKPNRPFEGVSTRVYRIV